MKRAAILIVSLLVAFMATSSVTGCAKIRERMARKAAEKAIENASGGDVKITSSGTSGGTVTVTDSTSGGTITSGSGAKLPDNWPSNIPTYPGATVQSSMTAGPNRTAIFQTKDTPSQVHDFYKSKLSGMKLSADIDANNSKVMSFKDGSRTISITASASGGNTVISISVAG